MAMTEIPSMKYEIAGDLIRIEQDDIQPTSVTLHRIHLNHLARAMKINVGYGGELSELVSYLARIKSQSEELYEFLAGVPSFPPSDHVSEDVLLAEQIAETANSALRLLVERIEK